MIFEIHAVDYETKNEKKFYYDNTLNILKDQSGNIFGQTEDMITNSFANFPEYKSFSKHNPLKKSKKITTLKIQLGLSCNYSCDYCSQKFVERPPETSKRDIDSFMEKLNVLEFDEEKGLKIEFWGGEPFVYWKTMKPLAEALKEKFDSWQRKPSMSVITNGSILTREICSWLYYMGFSVGISHDGPGQFVRGPDPFDDPEKKKIILEFYNIMKPLRRISFNTMMNRQNISRKAVHDWFVNLTGDPDVMIGEGGFVDAYDEDGLNSSLGSLQEHFNYRQECFNDFVWDDELVKKYDSVVMKIDAFISDVFDHKNSKFLGQKCSMDDEGQIAVDLTGNVMTCQNISVMEISKNGEPHLGGNLSDYDNVELKSVTHWSNRENCKNCPVLHICRGACMYLEGKYWDASCDNAYSDNVVLFALAFKKITGHIPTLILNESLPKERQDIWGTIFEHEKKLKKNIIPIKVIKEKVKVIDDIEVYGKSRAEV